MRRLPEPRVDPWRRTAGTHLLRDARALAIVKSLWEARDAEARERDTSPGRVLRDAAITAAAQAKPASLDALVEVQEWRSRGTKRRAAFWYPAIASAMALPDNALPPKRGPATEGPPQQRMWKEKRPEANERLNAARAGLAVLVDVLAVPAENLLQPDTLRRACWDYAGGGEAWISGDSRGPRGSRVADRLLCADSGCGFRHSGARRAWRDRRGRRRVVPGRTLSHNASACRSACRAAEHLATGESRVSLWLSVRQRSWVRPDAVAGCGVRR